MSVPAKVLSRLVLQTIKVGIGHVAGGSTTEVSDFGDVSLSQPAIR